ncbi:MAG: hypothetical protein IPO48_02065 [Saprospiraceae bacterium]|nr:hypothetical protein [Saprospiraceae bacterium]
MRPTRMSAVLEDSLRRLERIKAIDPPPNFGTGFSIADYETSLNELRLVLGSYNTAIGTVDQLLTQLKMKEKGIRDKRERVLTAIAFIYGKDSDEYVAAGGIRKSERKRPRPRTSSSATGSENVM